MTLIISALAIMGLNIAMDRRVCAELGRILIWQQFQNPRWRKEKKTGTLKIVFVIFFLGFWYPALGLTTLNKINALITLSTTTLSTMKNSILYNALNSKDVQRCATSNARYCFDQFTYTACYYAESRWAESFYTSCHYPESHGTTTVGGWDYTTVHSNGQEGVSRVG